MRCVDAGDAASDAGRRRVADQIMRGLIHLMDGIRRRVGLRVRACSLVHVSSPAGARSGGFVSGLRWKLRLLWYLLRCC